MCLHALRGMSRHWTAHPAGSYRFSDHGRKSQWSPTVHGPPITPGTPSAGATALSPTTSVRPSQHALARLRLPACDGRGCLAHTALFQMLCATLTIPSVHASVNQRSTDLSVRFGLAGPSVSALQGILCAPQSAATSLRIGVMGEGEPANTTWTILSGQPPFPRPLPQSTPDDLTLSHPERHVQTEQRRSAPCPRALRRGARSRGAAQKCP